MIEACLIDLDKRYCGFNGYRYGFNGKENDGEVKGEGNQQDYWFRVYDPRLGRFLSTDPLTKEYPWYTPYQFAGNKPVQAIDIDGLEEWMTHQENALKQQAMIKMEIDGGVAGRNPSPHFKIPQSKPAVIKQDYSRHPFAKSEGDAAYHKQLLNQASPLVPFGEIALDAIEGKEPSKLDVGIEVAALIPFSKSIMKSADLVGALIKHADDAAKVTKEGFKILSKAAHWNLGEAVITKSHHNWSKMFGNKAVKLSDVKPILEEAVDKGTWQTTGVLRGKGGKVIGDKIELVHEVNGHKIWVGGMKEHSTGKVIINN